jgi:hypothetical protein
MTAPVVPSLEGGRVTDQAIGELRQTALRSRFWDTRFGDGLLKWFWKSRLGLWFTKRFGDATPEELHGYAFWVPVALAITVTEILGATSKTFRDAIPWPTLSTTVGHLEDLHSFWGLVVVAIIAAAAYYSFTYEVKPPSEGREETYLISRGPVRIRYGWLFVYAVTGAIAYAVHAGSHNEDKLTRKFHLAYAIYGSFAVFGVAIPLYLVWRKSKHVVFPHLFYTLKCLSGRFHWVALAVLLGLSILMIHLALYPWPNLAREPASFAGVNAVKARAKARQALEAASDSKRPLIYSTQGRNVVNGQNAWSVYFSELIGKTTTYMGCVVTVTAKDATLSDECRNK